MRVRVTAESLHRVEHRVHQLRGRAAAFCAQHFAEPRSTVHFSAWAVRLHHSVREGEKRMAALEKEGGLDGAVREALDLVVWGRGDFYLCVAPVRENPSSMADGTNSRTKSARTRVAMMMLGKKTL